MNLNLNLPQEAAADSTPVTDSTPVADSTPVEDTTKPISVEFPADAN